MNGPPFFFFFFSEKTPVPKLVSELTMRAVQTQSELHTPLPNVAIHFLAG